MAQNRDKFVRYCKHSNELSYSMKVGKFLDQHRDYSLLKDSDFWSQSAGRGLLVQIIE
jgi:hypothetical protein